jgi:hypothetical protein
MLIYEPTPLNAIQIMFTLTVMDDLTIDELNQIADYIVGLLYQPLRKLFISWRKIIIKPIILEIVPIPSEQIFLHQMAQ